VHGSDFRTSVSKFECNGNTAVVTVLPGNGAPRKVKPYEYRAVHRRLVNINGGGVARIALQPSRQ